VKPFELVERSGQPAGFDALRDHVWIASFIFTRCTGPCPRISANMRTLQDPGRRALDVSSSASAWTPLLRHARGADAATPTRWRATASAGCPDRGRLDAMRKVRLRELPSWPFERDEAQPVGQLVKHKTLLTVVTATGAIRGYYDRREPRARGSGLRAREVSGERALTAALRTVPWKQRGGAAPVLASSRSSRGPPAPAPTAHAGRISAVGGVPRLVPCTTTSSWSASGGGPTPFRRDRRAEDRVPRAAREPP